MKVAGKIILIDDNEFEKELLIKSLKKLNWDIKVEHFSNPITVLNYLKETKEKIFLIISDVNMPQMSGIELKKAIDDDRELKLKAIPFIFSSTSPTLTEMREAYDYGVQGFFKKPGDLKGMTEMFDTIIKYWIICLHPNK